MDYRIYPPEQLIEDGIADLPLSKSMLNRRMVIEALTPVAPKGRCSTAAPVATDPRSAT